MKSFLRFIVSLLVIAIICGTVYYMLNVKNIEQPKNNNEENINNEIEINDKENVIDNNENTNENSNEINDSQENEINKQKSNIEDIISRNRNNVFKDYIDDSLDNTILGNMYDSFFDIFETDKLSVNIRRTEKAVFIIPTPDLLNSQEFYYYDDNTLAAYVIDFVGVGGQVKYYFHNNKLIDTVIEIDEEIEITHETEEEILKRAAMVYEKYLLNFRRES